MRKRKSEGQSKTWLRDERKIREEREEELECWGLNLDSYRQTLEESEVVKLEAWRLIAKRRRLDDGRKGKRD